MKSNHLNWSSTVNLLPHADIFANHVVITNVRDFVYKNESEAEKKYETVKVSLFSIIGVTYNVIPFKTVIPPGGAHIFVSFTIKNQESLSISFEAQRTPDQEYNPFVGIFPVYRLAGIVGTTRDIRTLRKEYRHDTINSYTLNLDETQTQNLFVELLNKLNVLNSETKYYNSLYKTCATCIIQVLNSVLPHEKKISFGIRTLLPGYSPNLLKKTGLIEF